MRGMRLDEGGEHWADAAEVDPWDCDSDEKGDQQQEHVLEDADPCHASYSAGEDKGGNESETDEHGRSAVNGAEAGDFRDDSETGDLDLDVGHQRYDSDEGHESGEPLVAVEYLEKVSLRLQLVPASVFPDEGEDEERDGVDEGASRGCRERARPGSRPIRWRRRR